MGGGVALGIERVRSYILNVQLRSSDGGGVDSAVVGGWS